MSDISIRLDGLLFGFLLVAGAGIFAAIALLSALRALTTKTPRNRSWKMTRFSLWLVLAHAAALALLAAYTGSRDSAPTGPDWIDWLALPWFCLIVAGLALLIRQLRRENGHRID